MIRTTTIAAILLLAFASLAGAAGMGASRGHDLDALWELGRDALDLDALDALLLLDSETIEAHSDGKLALTTHRVVWIGTAAGLRAHADLRIPWNSDCSTLDVLVLRTWRDGRWWPDAEKVSDTAVVETLPHALRTAYDYQGLRETMLLHDGVELPCIMETVYTVTLDAEAAALAHGNRVLTRNDPAVVSEFVLTAPRGLLPHAKGFRGAPSPVTEDDGETVTQTWRLDGAFARALPHTADAAMDEPHVAWRTWTGRTDGFATVEALFDAAAVVSDELAAVADEATEENLTELALARAVPELIDRDVRAVHYDDASLLHAPREAGRIWETGYAHELDRAVLAAALYRHLGFTTYLRFRALSAYTDDETRRIASFDRPVVQISRKGDRQTGLVGWYDPARNELLDWGGLEGETILSGTGAGGARKVESILDATYDLRLTLDRGDDGWVGRGLLRAGGALSPHRRLAGLGDELIDGLEAAGGALLPGLDATAAGPQVFSANVVEAGFAFGWTPPETGDDGRITLTLGTPDHTAASMLPRDVRLHHESRGTTVRLTTAPRQTFVVDLELGDLEVVQAPPETVIENEVGVFRCISTVEDGRLTIERSLSLAVDVVVPRSWPLLRALLLAEDDPAHRAVILR